MTKKRFESGEGDKGPMIYDNTGVDDYYFLNDPKEMEEFINLINSIETEWKENYNHVMGEYKKQLIQINEKDLQIPELKKENQKLTELINLIAEAHSYTKEESVKDILRHNIWAIDTVAGESAGAWHDYCILNKFFKEHYGEHWDNFEDK